MLVLEEMLARVSSVAVTILLVSAPTTGVAQKLYKHVDEKGNVSFSDRPQKGEHKAEKMRAPNVESREATRQTHIGSQQSTREEQAERMAAQRRAAAIQRKEYEEKARQRQLEEHTNPERAPRTVRIVR